MTPNVANLRRCSRCKRNRQHGGELREAESISGHVCVRLNFDDICDMCIRSMQDAILGAAKKLRRQ
jgi:hypothetical protein